MDDLALGSRVFHPDHGLGTVGWLGVEQVGVVFDVAGKVLLRREGCALRSATAADERQALQPQADVDSTLRRDEAEPFFLLEEPGAQHYLGSHWTPLFEEDRTFIHHLPQVVSLGRPYAGSPNGLPEAPQRSWAQRGVLLRTPSAALAEVFGEVSEHPWDEATPWISPGGALASDKASAIAWSGHSTGVAIVVTVDEGERALRFTSAFPYLLDGAEHLLRLRQVNVWESELEAQITAAVGEAELRFFDIDFVVNRDRYRANAQCAFILTGLAYRAGPAVEQFFTIPRSPEDLIGMSWLTGEDLCAEPAAREERVSTLGMAVFLGIDTYDRDEFQFRGPVKQVWGMRVFGQPAWRVRTTVMRPTGYAAGDFDLDIVITLRSWGGDAPPEVGQDIEGTLWLQGRYWASP